jgi:hypothetical protein
MGLAYVTHLAPRILRWLPGFWKICAALPVVKLTYRMDLLDIKGRQEDGWMDGWIDDQTDIQRYIYIYI